MEKIANTLEPETQPINKMSALSSCWELLYHVEKANVKSKQDIIVLMVHLTLIKNDFLCIHEEDNEQKPLVLSELLTPGWNAVSSGNNHRVRYFHDGNRYHFGANIVDDMFVMNFLNMANQTTHSLVINLDPEVQSTDGPLATMVPNNKEIFCKIWSDLVKPACSEGQKDMTVQTEVTSEEAQTQDFRSEEPRFRPPFPNPTIPMFPQGFDPLNVGSRDLNPFGPIGVGGGMLLENPRGGRILMPDRDFPGPGRLPRGSVPPGARFDPIHPGHPGRRGPDPDHLPMPGRGSGFSDHMFM